MKEAIRNLRRRLLDEGLPFVSRNWQGKPVNLPFIELINVTFRCDMEQTKEAAQIATKSSQPWADLHFAERVGGEPLNPPPSHLKWNVRTNEYLMEDKFSHSYPERMWSKGLHSGIRFDISDLNTLVELLKKDTTTRQAYLPIYFPEDLSAALMDERVPCTLGWHFIVRDNKMHCHYPIRSCDMARHFHHDVYFANLLTLWLLEKTGINATPGELFMNITSLHAFENDRYTLEKMNK